MVATHLLNKALILVNFLILSSLLCSLFFLPTNFCWAEQDFSFQSGKNNSQQNLNILPRLKTALSSKSKGSKLVFVVGNDSFSGNFTDRHLTSQIKLGAISKWRPESFGHFISNKDYLITTISQDLYTPENIKSKGLVNEDIPYAGWLYLTVGQLRQNKKTLSITSFDLGVVGPSALGEQTQTKVHSIFGAQSPNGWQHQLKDEFGFRAEHKKYFKTELHRGPIICTELLRFYGGTLGNIHSSVNMGAIFRAGYNIPNDFMVGVNPIINDQIRIFGFLKAQGDLVLKNIFLDGNTVKHGHSVDKEYLVARASAGATFMRGAYGVSFAQSLTTKEFKGQDGNNANAELRLILDFRF